LIAFVSRSEALLPNRDLEVRQPHLMPGLQLEETLTRKREHHLHAFVLDAPSNCTLTLQAPEHLSLRLLGTSFRAIGGPAMLIQQVLEPGAYWAHVTAQGGARGEPAPYRLRLHCVPL
jgi:hypothetical protein